MTPPHSAGIYYLFGFFLFGIIVASSCSHLRSPSAVPWVCLCECVCLGGRVCVVAPSEPSRVPSFACMRSPPADPRQPGGPLPGFSRVRPRRAVALLLLFRMH